MFNDTFKSSSIFLKLSLIPAFLGFINHLVSFASSNWRVIESPVPLLKIYPHVENTYCGLWNCFSCLSNNAKCESAVFPLEGNLPVVVESQNVCLLLLSQRAFIARQYRFICIVGLIFFHILMIN